ncbi:MAG: PAS domain S-box protein [Chloroflexi bacterium]|nr:PAS domain S-box protein [Chloroflexota bacterium]
MSYTRKTSPLDLLNNLLPQQNDERYRDIVEELVDALFLVKPISGAFFYVNDKALAFSGYARADFNTLHLVDIFSPDQSAEVLKIIYNVEAGVNYSLRNILFRARSGVLIPVDIRLSGCTRGDEDFVMILIREYTQRTPTQSLNRHRASITALGEMIEALPHAVSDDVIEHTLGMARQMLGADSVILYWRSVNPLGLRVGRAINFPSKFPSHIAADDPDLKSAAFSWRLGERPTSALARAARAENFAAIHSHVISDRLSLLGLFVVMYAEPDSQPPDTTALTAIAAHYFSALLIQLRRTQTAQGIETYASEVSQQLEAIMSQTNEGILRINATGGVVDLNSAAESLLGFHLEDMVNEPLEDVLVASQPLASQLIETLKRGARWDGVETDLVRRDGESLAAFVRATPLLDRNNVFIGGLIVITDRRQQKFFQTQSDHLERRAWLGDVSAIFAHDVRNPLNGISTGLGLFATKFLPPDPLAERVSMMQAEVVRIDQLVNNVLLAVKSSETHYQQTSLVPLLTRTLIRWAPRLAKLNIQLEKEIDPNTPQVMADLNQMDQVFTNLIVNAVDAIGNDGTLSIKSFKATHPQTPRGNFVELIFSDTGPGIPLEIQQRIFDPFITTKADGTGLGLAITKRIVNAHKGSIFVESFSGIGTAFHIFLPIAEKESN